MPRSMGGDVCANCYSLASSTAEQDADPQRNAAQRGACTSAPPAAYAKATPGLQLLQPLLQPPPLLSAAAATVHGVTHAAGAGMPQVNLPPCLKVQPAEQGAKPFGSDTRVAP